MKFNGNTNIITDDDIVFLNKDKQTLSDILDSQRDEINSLKSNLKWIYKYGGVGSGGSGGGGSSQPFSIFATLKDNQIKDNNNIILENEGIYPLYIKINNPNGAIFNIKYKYVTVNSADVPIIQERTELLSIENNYELNTNIKLNNNDLLIIKASDGNTTKQVSANYVTSPYIFNAYLCDNEDNLISDEIFVKVAKNKGINVKLDYSISVDSEVSYIFKFKDEEKQGIIEDKNNTLLFPINSELFKEENSGLHFADLIIKIQVPNQELITINKHLTFSLIPDSLYILCSPEVGAFYNTEELNPYLYNAGHIVLNTRVYQGINQDRTYKIYYKVNDGLQESTYTQERKYKQIRIYSNQAGQNTVTLSVDYGTERYEKTFYFYVKNVMNEIDWYDKKTLGAFNFFRLNAHTDNFLNLPYDNNHIIHSANNESISIHNIKKLDVSGSDHFDTHIALGLQYNQNNSDDNVILTCTNNDNISLVVYKNKIKVGNLVAEYLFPIAENYNIINLSEFHLLDIYVHYVTTISNNDYYELLVYIDGILESSIQTLLSYPLQVSDVTLNPINGIFNLIEISYLVSNSNNVDLALYKYYLKYCNSIKAEDITTEMLILPNYSDFTYDTNGDVVCTFASITNLSQNLNTPCMMFSIQDNNKDVLDYLKGNYKEENQGNEKFNVGLSWSKGSSIINTVNTPKEFEFKIQIQGSSTKQYKSKNFTLELLPKDKNENSNICLFSPNFKNNDPSTFLPENSFTLKADVVDSSHSNNTSVGKFVNTVCNKFNRTIGDQSAYSPFIKNCLDGFPFLLFLNLVQYDEESKSTENKYLYLGVYNFNLGRTSYFNLGYKDLSVFCNADNKGIIKDSDDNFTFYSIEKSQWENTKKDLIVAEVQGNDAYFDFSQWDPSILFKQTDGITNDSVYMFGDLKYGDSSGYKNSLQNMVHNISKAGGFIFDHLKKNFGPYSEKYHAVTSKNTSKNQVPDYHIKYYRHLVDNKWQYDDTGIREKGELSDLQQAITYDLDSGRVPFFDFDSLSEYYTICMAFGLVDSVEKNLNVKTWNKKTYYAAFYDMDTCLGVDNEGKATSYFAFSDYWDQQLKIQETSATPSNIRVYRDFYPDNKGQTTKNVGFDVPSSYLFAIAKYARLFLPDSEYTTNYPQELWATWRQLPRENGPEYIGCLSSADYFMKKFFIRNLRSIPEFLISENYRTKYFTLTDIAYSSDFEKFHGTRTAYVKEWLTGRFHLMDSYLNLQSTNNQIQYLDLKDNTWKGVEYDSKKLMDPGPSSVSDYLNRNEDIIILHHIFAENSSDQIQTSGTVNIQVKARENSPLFINTPTHSYNYLLGNDYMYNINIPLTGVQLVLYGGSEAWTYLENIDNLGMSGTLHVKSKNLGRLVGEVGDFNGYSLNTPALEILKLTGKNYTGNLSLNQDYADFSNLSLIDLSNSKINLLASGLKCKTINLENITSQTLNITGCNNLNTLNLKNASIDSLVLDPIPKNQKIFTIDGLPIKNINIAAPDSNEDYTLHIKNISKLSEINISNFANVQIYNCPNLKQILLSGKNKTLKILEVQNCGSNVYIGKTKGIIDLTNEVKLQSVYFAGTTSFETIKFPNIPTPISLGHQAFSGCTKLKYLTGTNVQISGSAVFTGCYNYTLKKYVNGPFMHFTFKEGISDLSDMFSSWREGPGGSLTLAAAKSFLKDVPHPEQIIDMRNIFYHQTTLGHSITPELVKQEHLNPEKSVFDFSKFVNLQHVNGMFLECGLGCLPKSLFTFGSNLYSLNIGLIAQFSTVPIDIYENIIEKITRNIGVPWHSKYMWTALDKDTYLPLDEFKLYDFLHFANPDGTIRYAKQLTSFKDFIPSNQQMVDLDRCLENIPVENIGGFMSFYSTSKVKNIEGLFYNCDKLKEVNDILSINNANSPINLFTLFNWEKLLSADKSALFVIYDGNLGGGGDYYHDFSIYKYITISDFQKLWNLILKSERVSIGHIFRNCKIISQDGLLQSGLTINTTIKEIPRLFYNCSIVSDLQSSEKIGLIFDENFFRKMPNLTRIKNTFSYVKFGRCLPPDMFAKRYEETPKTVYISELEDSYVPAKLHTYKYHKTIVDARECFYEADWESQSSYYDSELFKKLESDWIEYPEGQKYSKSTYYTKSIGINGDVYIPHELNINSEILDAEIPNEGEGSGYHINTVQKAYSSGPLIINNYQLPSEVTNHVFITPDIFYGMSENCSISNIFQTSKNQLAGLIPEHLLKYWKFKNFAGLFRNLNIIPRLLKSEQIGSTINNIYYYVPKNFTERNVLSECFNFHINIPNNIYKGDVKINNCFYVLLKSSVKDIISLNSALPIHARNSVKVNDVDLDFHYTIMYDDENNREGLDMDKYSQLTLDNLITEDLSEFLGGLLFNESFLINNGQLTNPKSYIINVGNKRVLSRSCKLPMANALFTKLHLFNNSEFNVYDDQILNKSTSKIYYSQSIKNQIIAVN